MISNNHKLPEKEEDPLPSLTLRYFRPASITIDPSLDLESRLARTSELMAEGRTVIFGGALRHATEDLYARINILQKNGDAGWDIISFNNSTKVKAQHIKDAAFHHYVVTGAGYRVASCYALTINSKYILQAVIDPDHFFNKHDITEKVLAARDDVADYIKDLKEAEPEEKIEPTPDTDLNDAPKLDILRNPAHLIKSPDPVHEIVNIQALRDFCSRLEYPLHFLDYETIMRAVPLFRRTSPYQQIPFQFSLHKQDTPDSALNHREFIHRRRTDPRPAFLKHLFNSISSDGSVIVYNAPFEKGRNKELARDFPAYAERLDQLNGRIVDLLTPFKNKALYHPDQKNSASIKKVLPAFTHLSYDDLEIPNGKTAADLYGAFMSGFGRLDKEKLFEYLLDYCGRDTYSMVALLKVISNRLSQNTPHPETP